MIDIFGLHYTTHVNLMRIKPTVLTYVKFLFIRGLSGKSPAVVKITRMVCMALMGLAAKGSGLECACVNNNNFTALVSGGGRRCNVSMCTVWPSHSK